MGNERRRHPRVQAALPIAVQAGAGEPDDLETQTHNISSRGAYFDVPRAIPEFTRVELTLCVPAGPDQFHRIQCAGVVVRCEARPQLRDGRAHAVAVFFDQIGTREQALLDAFIAEQLTAGA